MTSQRVSLVCTLLIGILSLSGDTTAAPQSRSIAADAAQIEKWIADLDNDNYTNREQATRSLVAAGRTAISPIAKAALSDIPEVSWRAGSILEQIGLAGDDTTLAEVVGAMQRLSESGRKSFDESRSLLVTKWRESRHDRAAKKLQQLGAVIQNGPGGWAFDGMGGFGGIPVAPVAVFDIDEDGLAEDAIVIDEDAIKEAEPAKTDEPEKVKEEDARRKKVEVPKEEKKADEPKQAEKLDARKVDDDLSKKIDKLVFEKLKGLDLKAVEIDRIKVDVAKPVIKPLEIRPLEDKAVEEKVEVEEVERVVVEIADVIDAPIVIGDVGFVLPPPMLLDLGGGVWHDAGAASNHTRTVSLGKAWKGTDEDLALLSQLDRVITVSVNQFKLSKQAVAQIARMRQLQRLQINHSQFDRDSLLGLKQKRPNISIYATGKTVLGVSGTQDPNGFKVTHVAPNSGAQKAGVRIGDVITAADGVKLKSLDELTLVVAPRKVGDKLALRIFREGKTVSAQATLGLRGATGVNARLLHEFIEDSAPVPLIDPR